MNFQDYVVSEKHEKRVWWWPTKWFVLPNVLTQNEWIVCDEYFKEGYPIQYFLRDLIPGLSYGIRFKFDRVWYYVKGSLVNPRKRMRDRVFPVRYNDLDDIIVNFHMQAIIELVEGEKYFERVAVEENDSFFRQLKECYEYAINGREELEKKLSEALNKVEAAKIIGSYFEKYKEVNAIEKDIEMWDLKVCEWVIQNKKNFWT